MKRIAKYAASVATLTLLALAPPAFGGDAAASAGTLDSGWETIIYPVYGWLPLYRAETRLPEVPDDGGGATVPEGTTDSSLEQAVFAAFRIDKDRFSLEGGFLYAGLSAERERPRVKTEVDTSLADLRAGYEVSPDFFIEAGVRYLALDMKATVDVYPEVSWKPDVLQPLVGFTYRPLLGKNWRLVLHGDVGGVVTDDGMSASATARIEWQPLKHFLLTAGGSVLYLKTEGTIRSRDVELDQTLYGPVVGIGIPF